MPRPFWYGIHNVALMPFTSSRLRSRKLSLSPVTRRESPILSPTSLTVRSSMGLPSHSYRMVPALGRKREFLPSYRDYDPITAVVSARVSSCVLQTA